MYRRPKAKSRRKGPKNRGFWASVGKRGRHRSGAVDPLAPAQAGAQKSGSDSYQIDATQRTVAICH